MIVCYSLRHYNDGKLGRHRKRNCKRSISYRPILREQILEFPIWVLEISRNSQKFPGFESAERAKMLDREPEELQFLGVLGILSEAFKILRSCVKQLGAITLTLILPLSFAILGHTLVSDPLIRKIDKNEDTFERQAGSPDAERTKALIYSEWSRLLLFQGGYLVFLLAFSLLSTAAVVYTVACIYTGKQITYAKVMSVVPRVWKRLMLTFLWYFLIMVGYNTALIVAFVLVFLIVGVDNIVAFSLCVVVLVSVFLAVHVYISAIWHVASVISVLEDRYGISAIQKSRDLIKGKRLVAFVLIFFYFLIWAGIQGVFRNRVVHASGGGGIGSRVGFGFLLIGLMVYVNLIGLLVQSVLYYVCKSYHHQSIDKSALSDHLEEYLGEYVPLKSSNIQMEDLDV